MSQRTREEVREALEGVLRRRTDEPPSLLDRVLEWLGDVLGAEGSRAVGEVVLWIVLVVLAVLLVVFLVRIARDGWNPTARLELETAAAGPTVAERVALLRAEAAQARARGEHRLALRKLFFALVLGLGSRGDLEFRDAWTYHELLARGRVTRARDALLAPLVNELEAKEFGDEPVHPADLERLEELCDRHLGASA